VTEVILRLNGVVARSMVKIPYFQLSVEVDKLYNYSLTDDKVIEEHCEFIRQFIESCGWEVEDYISTMMNEGIVYE
jgi:hypothetical protein